MAFTAKRLEVPAHATQKSRECRFCGGDGEVLKIIDGKWQEVFCPICNGSGTPAPPQDSGNR